MAAAAAVTAAAAAAGATNDGYGAHKQSERLFIVQRERDRELAALSDEAALIGAQKRKKRHRKE